MRKLPPRMLLIASLVLAVGCGPHGTSDPLLLKAYELGEAYQWETARSYVKRYLAHNPDSAPGHLLYAKSYLRVPDANLAIAKGELDTALTLFEASPDLGVLTGKWTSDEFLGLIHHEMATVYLRRIYILSSNGMGTPIIRHDLEAARRQVELGLKADPASKSLQMMRTTLDELMTDGSSAPA